MRHAALSHKFLLMSDGASPDRWPRCQLIVSVLLLLLVACTTASLMAWHPPVVLVTGVQRPPLSTVGTPRPLLGAPHRSTVHPVQSTPHASLPVWRPSPFKVPLAKPRTVRPWPLLPAFVGAIAPALLIAGGLCRRRRPGAQWLMVASTGSPHEMEGSDEAARARHHQGRPAGCCLHPGASWGHEHRRSASRGGGGRDQGIAERRNTPPLSPPPPHTDVCTCCILNLMSFIIGCYDQGRLV